MNLTFPTPCGRLPSHGPNSWHAPRPPQRLLAHGTDRSSESFAAMDGGGLMPAFLAAAAAASSTLDRYFLKPDTPERAQISTAVADSSRARSSKL